MLQVRSENPLVATPDYHPRASDSGSMDFLFGRPIGIWTRLKDLTINHFHTVFIQTLL